MKSMKLSKKEAKEEFEAVEVEKPQYPYGLRLHLDKEALSKLGIEKLPEVGQAMILHAQVEVCEVSHYKRQGAEDEKRMELQITDMELSDDNNEEAADSIYGE